MKLIRAGLGESFDQRAALHSLIGLERRGGDFHLRHGIRFRIDIDHTVAGVAVHGYSVDLILIHLLPLAGGIDLKAILRSERGYANRARSANISRGIAQAGYTGRQRGYAGVEVLSNERRILHGLRLQSSAHVATRGIHALGLGCNDDVGDLFANRQLGIERSHLVAFEFDIRLHPGLKARRLHFGAISAQGQVSYVDVSLAVGHGGLLHLRILICDRNLCTCNCGPGGISYRSFKPAHVLGGGWSER